jgi:hypothetical protein
MSVQKIYIFINAWEGNSPSIKMCWTPLDSNEPVSVCLNCGYIDRTQLKICPVCNSRNGFIMKIRGES